MSTHTNSLVMVGFSNVVDSRFCCSNSINLRIDMDVGEALNDKNEVIFRMEKHLSHRRRRILLDASNKSVCILHKKKVSTHGRWEAYKGDTSQLSFIVKRSAMYSSEDSIVLDVFLANNTEESVCKVKASSKKNACEIYSDESTLAKANAIEENKDAMQVEIKDRIDHAFIVALLMIVDEKRIKKFEKVGKTVQAIPGVMGFLAASSTVYDFVDKTVGDDDEQQAHARKR